METLSLVGLFSVGYLEFNKSSLESANLLEILHFVWFLHLLHNPTCSLFIVKHLVWKRYKIYEIKKQSDINF